MQILVVPGGLGEAAVVVGHENREQGVAGVDVVGAGQAQLLHQPVLQRLVHPLDAALRLRGVGADDVDVELGQGAAKLRHTPGPAPRALVVHAEDAVLVAVEGHRLAVALKIRAGRGEVVERGLALQEAQLHQPTGRVVDVDQERAAPTAVLEPGVLAPIDLYQLAEALAPVARLMRRPDPLAPPWKPGDRAARGASRTPAWGRSRRSGRARSRWPAIACRTTARRSSSLLLISTSSWAIRPAPERHHVAESGHFYLARSGHFHLAATRQGPIRKILSPRSRDAGFDCHGSV